MKRANFTLFFFILALCVLSGCALLQNQTAGETGEPVEAGPKATATQPGDDENVADSTVGLSNGPMVFKIVSSESTVQFELEEHLRSALTGWAIGARIPVIGTTDQVTGELTIDFANPKTTQMGDVRIDARTFKTDEFIRNVAIHRKILATETYPFITFTPSSINDLPDSIQIGESIMFTIDGDLTIRDTTLPQTFTVSAMLLSEMQLEGTANAVINRNNYGLEIPNVPNVTDVEENVDLSIEFVARTE